MEESIGVKHPEEVFSPGITRRQCRTVEKGSSFSKPPLGGGCVKAVPGKNGVEQSRYSVNTVTLRHGLRGVGAARLWHLTGFFKVRDLRDAALVTHFARKRGIDEGFNE